MTEPTPLLSVRNLQTVFPARDGLVRAVNDVSFDVMRGQVVGIVGESGSGKSVTARSIMRMVPPPGSIATGTIEFDGRDLLTLSNEEMREIRGRGMAMVFQDPQAALNPVMTVGDQIAEALTVHGSTRKAANARAVELLELVGIPDARNRASAYPHQFSGGMRQRVVIAVALANNPSLLIADEPTTALDVTIQAQILRLLVRLRDELDVAIVMITHDMGVVAELCDDVVVMYGGRVMERGGVEAIFTQPEHPYTADLLRAMPRLDSVTSARLPAIPGAPPDPARLPAGCAFHPRCRLAEARCSEELPQLRPQDETGDHAAACWVTQSGGEITDLQPASSATQQVVLGVTKADTMPVLEVSELRTDVGSRRRGLFSREDPVYAVDGVSLTVHAGETLGLVGESGCGKSTLSRTIVGINRPASGTISIDGRDVTPMRSAEQALLRHTVQYIFQDPYASLNPRRTIRQTLTEALATRHLSRTEIETRSKRLMETVGLNERHLDRYPQAFSGGQRQRIGIARALAVEPRLIICDEPVSALDVSIQAQVINLLAELRDQIGLAYVFVAHDLAIVRHLSDRIAVMYLGRVVETGPAEAVYTRPQHPYTAALLSSSPIPDVGAAARNERIVLRGDMPSPKDPPSGCRFRTRCPIGPLYQPERTVCVEQDPQLVLSGDQLAACHFPGELVSATNLKAQPV